MLAISMAPVLASNFQSWTTLWCTLVNAGVPALTWKEDTAGEGTTNYDSIRASDMPCGQPDGCCLGGLRGFPIHSSVSANKLPPHCSKLCSELLHVMLVRGVHTGTSRRHLVQARWFTQRWSGRTACALKLWFA